MSRYRRGPGSVMSAAPVPRMPMMMAPNIGPPPMMPPGKNITFQSSDIKLLRQFQPLASLCTAHCMFHYLCYLAKYLCKFLE